MKKIKKLNTLGAQSVSAFVIPCGCSCTGCTTCQGCKSGDQVYSLAQGASASYNGNNAGPRVVADLKVNS